MLRSSCLALLLAAAPLLAQQTPPPPGGIGGVITGTGFTKIKIAVPDPVTDGTLAQAAREIGQTVRDDLDFSGYFEVVPPSLYPLAATSPETTPDAKWASLGAGDVAFSRLGSVSGRLDFRARLQTTSPASTLFDRRYGGPPDLARRVAHQLADDIVQQLTGQPGIASTWIAFVSSHDKGKEIYMMDYDGQRVRRITTTNSINLMPTWSPVAQRLAFMTWRSGPPAIDILESDGRIARAQTAGGTLNIAPDWAPDGRKIVYASNAAGNADIYILDLAAGRSTRLTNSPAIDTSPSFSPTGREIAFTSDRSGAPQIYVMDAEGLNPRRLTSGDEYADAAAWSPKGDKIAYASRVDGRFEIVVVDVASGAATTITHHEGNSENPRWAPDGHHIVFSSNRAGSYDIYTMRSDGTDVRRLTRGGDCITPDWSHRVP
ncbi:MAG TPA: Tol-Pal system beta propeller repeat protein TolB [Candidatus Polarisedimenticolaceae bacterium]|nr:Tol-Pal system beta propeller repeat protein TolB [Candidatus Polarisedimenticolaceae bacterium]